MGFSRITILAISIVFLLTKSLSAAPVLGESNKIVRWNINQGNPVIRYYISDEGLIGASFIRSAASEWTNVNSSYVTLQETYSSGDAHIIVNVSNDHPRALRSGVVNKTIDDGTLKRCEIQIIREIVTFSQNDGRAAALHLMGHCLGLTHSVVQGSMMNVDRDGQPSLSSDDLLAITRLYPKDTAEEHPKSCGSLMGVDSGNFMGPYLFLFGLIYLGLWSMKSRTGASRLEL